jgi:acyl carrier protein
MIEINDIRDVLRDTLELGARADGFDASTELFGSLPELDSMAVVDLIGALEDRFGIVIDDDEIGGEIFETVGSLQAFVAAKAEARAAHA